MRLFSPTTQKFIAGLTLIELLVTVTIVTFITAGLLFRHRQFSGNILVTNLAYDIGLTARQAQVYGLGSREAPVGGSGVFTAGYGIHVESANPDRFIFFTDLNGNHRYDGTADCTSECINKYSISYGDRFSDICVTTSGGSEQCSSLGAITYADVSFIRPNPDAFIATNVGTSYRSTRFTVTSPQGVSKTVTIYSTGQISIN